MLYLFKIWFVANIVIFIVLSITAISEKLETRGITCLLLSLVDALMYGNILYFYSGIPVPLNIVLFILCIIYLVVSVFFSIFIIADAFTTWLDADNYFPLILNIARCIVLLLTTIHISL